jgi:hypothetical protein
MQAPTKQCSLKRRTRRLLPALAILALSLLWMLATSPVSRADAAAQASVTLVSERNNYLIERHDYVVGGENRLFDSPSAIFLRGGREHVGVDVEYRGHFFEFEFSPPSGKQLEVGEYASAERFPAEGSPGIEVSGDGRGCNEDFGRFVVKDIHFSAAGNVDRLWALYEQHCEHPEAPALFGEVRVGEPPTGAPESVEPAAIEWPDMLAATTSVHVPVTVVGGEAGAQVATVSVEGPDARDFKVASDACSGVALAPAARCALAIAVKPKAPGLRTAQLLVTDASGAKTTVPLAVEAEPRLAISSATLVSEPGDWLGGGADGFFDAPHALSFLGGSDVRVSAEYKGERATFEFDPPSGQQLEDGEYLGAERLPTAASPGLRVSVGDKGCNQTFGRFVVKDISFSTTGRVDRFWALYEHRCESAEVPALFGEVRVNEPPTEAPEAVEPTAIEWPPTAVGSSGVTVPLRIVGGEFGAHLVGVTLTGADAGDFSVVSDGCAGRRLAPGARCELAVAVRPTAAGLRTAQLVVADKSGAQTLVLLTVHA